MQDTVQSQISSLSYIVSTPSGSLHRNWKQLDQLLNFLLEDGEDVIAEQDTVPSSPMFSRSTAEQPPQHQQLHATGYRTRSSIFSLAPNYTELQSVH